MLELDGSLYEGGGQMLRVALGFSILTGAPFRMKNIRALRPSPGLKAQHMKVLEALLELSHSTAGQAEVGSKEIIFRPGPLKSRTLAIDIGTAGSITLLLQALFLPLAFAPGKVRLKLKGGTDVAWSPPFDYMQHVFLPHLRPFYQKMKVSLITRGYYPAGQGRAEISIKPKFDLSDYDDYRGLFKEVSNTVAPIRATAPAPILKMRGVSHAASVLREQAVAERQAKGARKAVQECPIAIHEQYSPSACPGSGITLWPDEETPFRGAGSQGAKGLRSELVGKRAAENLSELATVAVDCRLGDQLMPYMALLPGSEISVQEVTGHMKSANYVISCFLGQGFKIEGTSIRL